MPCDHLGPPEIIELAEAELRLRGVGEPQWAGLRIMHVEHLPPGSMWASVVIGAERRDGGWVVTRIDRLREPAADPAGLTIA